MRTHEISTPSASESRRAGPSLWSEVRHLVNRTPVSVSESDPLGQVARTLWAENVGLALVRSERGQVVGLISERDLVGAMALGVKESATAADIMVMPLIVVRPTDSLYDAAAQMLDYGIRHMPVADSDGDYSGVISIRDVLRPLLVESFGG
jgi:CBS domain-containing protein